MVNVEDVGRKDTIGNGIVEKMMMVATMSMAMMIMKTTAIEWQ